MEPSTISYSTVVLIHPFGCFHNQRQATQSAGIQELGDTVHALYIYLVKSFLRPDLSGRRLTHSPGISQTRRSQGLTQEGG